MSRAKARTVEKEEKYELNPLAWGMLFFAFWLSLIILPIQLSIGQKILAWFCFGFSVILFISIWVPWLRKQYKRPTIKTSVLPIVFEITIASFVVGFISSLSSIGEILRQVVMYFGFIWVVTYLFVLIRTSNKGIGVIASLVFIVHGAYLVSQANNSPDMIAGIVSILIGLFSGYIAIKRPEWLWHRSLV